MPDPRRNCAHRAADSSTETARRAGRGLPAAAAARMPATCTPAIRASVNAMVTMVVRTTVISSLHCKTCADAIWTVAHIMPDGPSDSSSDAFAPKDLLMAPLTSASSSAATLNGRQEALRELIQDRWAEHGLPFQGNAPARVVASRPARIQEHSVLFDYSITFLEPQPPLDLIAKIYRHSRPNNDIDLGLTDKSAREGRAEWEELSNAYRHFAERADGLGVVRPVGYIEPYHALLVEKASGHELAKIVGTPGSNQAPALMRAGRWLSRFHTLHALSNRNWTSEWYASRLDERRSRFLSLNVSRERWEPHLDRFRRSRSVSHRSPFRAPCSTAISG